MKIQHNLRSEQMQILCSVNSSDKHTYLYGCLWRGKRDSGWCAPLNERDRKQNRTHRIWYHSRHWRDSSASSSMARVSLEKDRFVSIRGLSFLIVVFRYRFGYLYRKNIKLSHEGSAWKPGSGMYSDRLRSTAER